MQIVLDKKSANRSGSFSLPPPGEENLKTHPSYFPVMREIFVGCSYTGGKDEKEPMGIGEINLGNYLLQKHISGTEPSGGMEGRFSFSLNLYVLVSLLSSFICIFVSPQTLS